MSRMVDRTLLVSAAATVALTAASLTAVVAAQSTASHSPTGVGMMRTGATSSWSSCALPSSLPGQRVTVMLGDMRGSMMRGRSPTSGATDRMMLQAVPTQVAAGTVTLVAVNHGSRVHELVVLPLAAGSTVGTRTVGASRTADEAGSLGEASRSCGSGSGDGIAAGSAGWVTLRLEPGRYELVCNLPGHYSAGMYAELDVT